MSAVVTVQDSLLPVRCGRQVGLEVVGAEPSFTYSSASPVPPEMLIFPVLPDGTTSA